MPESRVRRKRAFTPPAPKSGGVKPSPRWFAPLMVALLVGGLIWVVVYYLSDGGKYPIPDFGTGNLIAGFAIMLTGFVMATRWR